MTTIRDVWGVPAVERLLLADRNYKEHPDYSFVNPNLLVGLELEIEKWETEEEASFRGFSFTADNSLRGASVEAITKPMRTKYVPVLLENFYEHFHVTDDNYSERCSTHVHVNCQDLTRQQLRNICVLYQAIERVLFAWIGEVREQNIFCIPWYQCNISSRFVHNFLSDTDGTVRRWQKYTALNLLPIREQGTIEFRHLEGTCDIKRITTWLNIIGSIFRFACEVTYKELRGIITEMNSVSNYEMFINRVFGVYATEFVSLPSYRELLAIGVVDCKLLLIDDHKVDENATQPPRVEPRREAQLRAAPARTPSPLDIIEDDAFEPPLTNPEVTMEPSVDVGQIVANQQVQLQGHNRLYFDAPATPNDVDAIMQWVRNHTAGRVQGV